MSKIAYEYKSFQPFQEEIIAYADQIMRTYAGQGYSLTLRQLYYQFIGRDLFPERWRNKETGSKNHEKTYDKFGVLVSDARLAGLLDWRYLVDRTRTLEDRPHWSNPESVIYSAERSYHIKFREGQSYRPEVWVEKDALIDVVGQATHDWDVPHFACRGYVSQSALWAAAQRYNNDYLASGQVPVVIYLGDHDPSGLDMDRDIQRRLSMFRVSGFEFRRIALTFDQVQDYNLPPSPAKVTDSRANAYIEEYGDESWELDALEPSVMTNLIETELNEWVDLDLLNERKEQEAHERQILTAISDNYGEVESYLVGQGYA